MASCEGGGHRVAEKPWLQGAHAAVAGLTWLLAGLLGCQYVCNSLPLRPVAHIFRRCSWPWHQPYPCTAAVASQGGLLVSGHPDPCGVALS